MIYRRNNKIFLSLLVIWFFLIPKTAIGKQPELFLSSSVEVFLLSAYKNKNNHKAIALGPYGSFGSSWGAGSKSWAKKTALKNCEHAVKRSIYKNIPRGRCRIYAVDNKIGLVGKTLKNPIGSVLANPDKPLIKAHYNRAPVKTQKGVLIYLHGCSGFHLHYEWKRWANIFSSLGLRVIVPNSFADPRPGKKCGKIPLSQTKDRTVVQKLRIAQTLRTIKNVKKQFPHQPIFVWGQSEGGAVSQWINTDVAGIIATGTNCGTWGIGALLVKSSVPLLMLLGTKDPYLKTPRKGKFKYLTKLCKKAVKSKQWRFVVMKGIGHLPYTKNKIARREMTSFIKTKMAKWEKENK